MADNEFHSFFDKTFASTFDDALERHGDPERAANACVHSYAKAGRSWWWLGRTTNPARHVHRHLASRSSAKWLTEIGRRDTASSVKARVYVAATEVAGTRRRVSLAATGTLVGLALLVAGVASFGTNDPTPRDIVSAETPEPGDSRPTKVTPNVSGAVADLAPQVSTTVVFTLDPVAFGDAVRKSRDN